MTRTLTIELDWLGDKEEQFVKHVHELIKEYKNGNNE